MATIKQPVQDILTLLGNMQVVNADGNTVVLYTRVWNNQYKLEQDGKLYSYAKPAAFVEVVNQAAYSVLGQGYRSADIIFRIHLIHEYYNIDGTLEQDLAIFDLRDAVIALLHLHCPTGCGPLNAVKEQQEYDHTNIYHYTIDFVCNFTDTGGSTDGQFIYSVPPYDAQIETPAP